MLSNTEKGRLHNTYTDFFCILFHSFDQICRRHLNLGFQRVEKIQSQYLKDLKSKLPRRESARRNHKYAKHCDILTAIDTRYSYGI